MINLIPPEGQKTARAEYILRAGSVFAILFGVVLLCMSAMHIPMYVLVDAQIRSLEAMVGVGGSVDVEVQDADADVTRTKEILAQLKTTKKTFSAVDAFVEVQKIASPAIIFKAFGADVPVGDVHTIKVQGVAPTREALAQFKSDIESSDMFTKAQIPIADLARDVDLPFVITITLATEK